MSTLPQIVSPLPAGQKIAFIQGNWHTDIVGQSREGFIEECVKAGLQETDIEIFDVPGGLEIPLMAKKLAETGKYACITGSAFVVNGGIYRHDFVAHAILQGIMRVQLDTGVPVMSVVLTPHHFHEHEEHENYYFKHMRKKGAEAAEACLMMLCNEKIVKEIDDRRAA